jgi:hypothetical protein
MKKNLISLILASIATSSALWSLSVEPVPSVPVQGTVFPFTFVCTVVTPEGGYTDGTDSDLFRDTSIETVTGNRDSAAGQKSTTSYKESLKESVYNNAALIQDLQAAGRIPNAGGTRGWSLVYASVSEGDNTGLAGVFAVKAGQPTIDLRNYINISLNGSTSSYNGTLTKTSVRAPGTLVTTNTYVGLTLNDSRGTSYFTLNVPAVGGEATRMSSSSTRLSASAQGQGTKITEYIFGPATSAVVVREDLKSFSSLMMYGSAQDNRPGKDPSKVSLSRVTFSLGKRSLEANMQIKFATLTTSF